MAQRGLQSRPRGTRRGGSPRRQREWFGISATSFSALAAGVQQTLAIIEPSGDVQSRNGTIVRTLGNMVLRNAAISQSVIYRLTVNDIE